MPESRIEEIGKIKLDLTHYPGEDRYCDGDVEDELLEIARDYSTVEYQRIIEERRSWPILYHLSPLRGNIVEWLPITKEMKVLEVGSGCGAITGTLAGKAAEVTCIDLSGKRSRINAYRHMDAANVTIHVGNFQDIEPTLPCDYDYICLIGVFEYAQAYIQSEQPYENFLNIVRRHVKPDGHIAIAIENKFGLKYWAGCREDHLGAYFAGLENYPEGGVVRTFTRDGLLKIAGNCGFTQAQMYYPYPDYKFMTSLYSDERLPQVGELSSNLRNFDRDRLQLFDEKKVFDTIIKEKQFPLFSNSYMLLLGPALEEQYVKYSNDRREEFCIKTVQRKCARGKIIEKHPLSKAAWKHLEETAGMAGKLSARFAGSGLSVNRCNLERKADGLPCLQMEYIEGNRLEELLDTCLEKNDIEGFQSLFDEYLRRISHGEEQQTADYDLIFANIIIPGDVEGEWHVIDYEWSFAKRIETKEIAFRAIYCYLLENEKRNRLNLDLVMEKLDITQSDAEQYRRQEMAFQQYVTGKRMSMPQIREAIGYPVYTVEEFCRGQKQTDTRDRIQIYEDTGGGFQEEQSFFIEDTAEEQIRVTPEGMTELEVIIGRGRSALRIDPCSDFCLVYLQEIRWNGREVPLKGKQVQNNGMKVGENTYVFRTQDPNITLSLMEMPGEERNLLQVKMTVTRLPEETAKHMQKRGFFGV
ncbi:MAG: class I SAM-dependent methyltransferase [Lachnospiraceae bacterium]|nr:class I SAM-dependent methyltransferase [Lachnospiraceae bacterium]